VFGSGRGRAASTFCGPCRGPCEWNIWRRSAAASAAGNEPEVIYRAALLSLALRAICNMKNVRLAFPVAFGFPKRLAVAPGSKLGPFIIGWPEARASVTQSSLSTLFVEPDSTRLARGDSNSRPALKPESGEAGSRLTLPGNGSDYRLAHRSAFRARSGRWPPRILTPCATKASGLACAGSGD
jgi:hypothetical protein